MKNKSIKIIRCPKCSEEIKSEEHSIGGHFSRKHATSLSKESIIEIINGSEQPNNQNKTQNNVHQEITYNGSRYRVIRTDEYHTVLKRVEDGVTQTVKNKNLGIRTKDETISIIHNTSGKVERINTKTGKRWTRGK